MRIGISIAALLLTPATVLYGQAVPAGTGSASSTPASSAGSSAGFSLPSVDGTVHYALSASQIIQYGYFGPGNVAGTAALSGDVSYSSTSMKAPFSLVYAGGVLLSESSVQGTTTYQNLDASQTLSAGKWVFNISDSVSYLPQSPTVGFSGIPGVGDVGTLPGEGPVLGTGGILTGSGNRVTNGVSGSAERLITGKTSVSTMGSWTILHFLDGNDGFDTSDVTGEAALNHRIDARDTISANVDYSLFTFGKDQGGINFVTRGINGVYTRALSRSMGLSISAGPQWVSSSDSALIPSSLNLATSIGLSYARGLTSANIGYSRGVNSGSGIQIGGVSDMVSAGVGHSFTRTWQVSTSGAYTHTSALATGTAAPPPGLVIPLGGAFSTVYGSLQASHSLSRTLSAYVSYTAQHQTYDASYAGTNAFNGTSQTFGIGISWAPRATRLGQF